MLNPEGAACVLRELATTGYRFTAVTPMTHQRVLARRGSRPGTTLHDIFGWNLPFRTEQLPARLRGAMAEAGMLEPAGPLSRSNRRVASLDGDLFFHSTFPTIGADAVFFGPDSYRFARFIKQALTLRQAHATRDAPVRVLDIGCGTGAGGIVVARALAAAHRTAVLTMNDINPLALASTFINAQVAGIPITLAEGDAFSSVAGEFDLIVCNPPYLDDDAQRAYRHGGAGLGRALGMRIATEALSRLAPGGQLLLYTGVAMVDGADPFIDDMAPLLTASGCEWTYDEIDPDVFGEEIERPVYAHIDRIAAVGLIATRPTQNGVREA